MTGNEKQVFKDYSKNGKKIENGENVSLKI